MTAPSAHNALVTAVLNKLRASALACEGVTLDTEETGALASMLGVVNEQAETLPDGRARFTLHTRLDDVGGAVATLHDRASDRTAEVRAEGRAVLLHALAQHGSEWVERGDVATAVWGKRAAEKGDPNALHVLIHRLRGELEKKGFAPWVVETRRNAIRLKGVEVLDGEACAAAVGGK